MTDIRAVHHINAASFDSLLAGRFVTHTLVCETDDGIVLVDTGMGAADITQPGHRLGILARTGRLGLGPVLDHRETVQAQLRALGYDTPDVRHIVATHLDYDHIGGRADFPDAILHVTETELHAARAAYSPPDTLRYRRPHIDNLGDVKEYGGAGETILGLHDAYPIGGVDGIWLAPMPGHSAGHAAVIIDTTSGWLVHAGDAFMHHSSITPSPNRSLRKFIWGQLERLLADDPSRIESNHRTLRALAEDPRNNATVFCSHDPIMLARLRGH